MPPNDPSQRRELLPDQAAWVTSAEGEEALARAEQLDSHSTVEQVAQLRKSLSPEEVHLVLQQLELARRGEDKFPEPSRMRFSPLALQQATDHKIARYKSERFVGRKNVADLCCGLGGDLRALGEALARQFPPGRVTGVDAQQAMVELAEYNCRHLENVSVHAGTVEEFDLHGYCAWHLDPDRRPDGHRTTRAEFARPGVETIERLRHQCEDGAIKMAPGAFFPESWQREAELEWIGHRRQCRQLVSWFGSLARAEGMCRATVVEHSEDDRLVTHTFEGSPEARIMTAIRPGRYLMEPESAVKAANLTDALGEYCRLEMLDDAGSYLTGDHLCDHPLFHVFEILEVLPLDRKKLKRLISERNIGHLEIKKRSVDVAPETLRRQLKLKGDRRAVLILCSIDSKGTAILARRCTRR